MKSLATLIKLQKTRVDEQRLMLAKLQTQLESFEHRIMQLEITKAREQGVAEKSNESRTTYGVFLKNAIKQGRDLERGRQIAAAAVEAARKQLTELYEEQKRYEIAEEARLKALEFEEKRRETIQYDETGSINYTRNKAKK